MREAYSRGLLKQSRTSQPLPLVHDSIQVGDLDAHCAVDGDKLPDDLAGRSKTLGSEQEPGVLRSMSRFVLPE
jgi:hypothetical protein